MKSPAELHSNSAIELQVCHIRVAKWKGVPSWLSGVPITHNADLFWAITHHVNEVQLH